MRIAAKEGNVRHMAAPNRHPDRVALGTAFGFMPKNMNNTKRLNPDPSLKQAVNLLGTIRVTRVSRQMKAIAGILRHQTRTLIGRLWVEAEPRSQNRSQALPANERETHHQPDWRRPEI